jgi:predicted transglutaminase-like cysteine proteinase
VISVLAEAGLPDQELEGLCYASVTTADGQAAQIHAVLLENRDAALDNIFFKSFGSGSAQTV